jgi:hypothetical protein
MKIRWVSLLVALAVAIPLLAHGDKKHIMGTIEKVSAESVTVKTAQGKLVEVKLAATTIYVTKDDKPAKSTDLAAGQRVVIHATPKGTELIANQVKFAPAQ